ncbi:MAG TPA: winged helix-turn-helix domain-containing protein [Pyrinomonadaceae bacterium]|nr:winged helix-turn-helix domain-containing protein [Pyrinomonadaceae bacterium]
MAAAGVNNYKFRNFEIDASRRILLDEAGTPVPLTPKVFDLLLFLVENRGKLLTKDEIMSAVWPDTIVEESNLTQNISILRRALGDTRGENAFIATIPGRGYKWVAEVRYEDAADLVTERADAEPNPTAAGERVTRRIAVAVVICLAVIVIAAGGFYIYRSRTAANASGEPKILAVLPFKPLVEENSDEALQIGMTDTLIAQLSNMSGIVLRPLSSVRKFARGEQDPQAAGRELGADTVLDGSVQRWGDQVRVNVRLIDVGSGKALWGGSFDEKYKDIFTVQDAIATRVAEALRLRLRVSNSTASAGGTRDVDAYRLYLQGRLFQFRSTRNEILQAIGFYQQAIKIDPDYALAYASMADAYRMLPITSDTAADEAFPAAKAAAQKAVELDDNLSDAHIALGYVASWYDWDQKMAEAEMRRAITLSPNNSDAHRGLSILLTVLGRHDEAIDEMKLARELDPLSLPTNALEAQTLHYAGRDAEAIDRLNKTFEIDPDFWIARLMLARIYINQGRWDEALAELQRARAASNGNTESISLAGYVFAKTGRRAEAFKALEELNAYSTDSYVPAYNIAMVFNGLGDANAALDHLEDAARRHDVRLILLKVEHKWDALRAEPRFEALMRRVGFE